MLLTIQACCADASIMQAYAFSSVSWPSKALLEAKSVDLEGLLYSRSKCLGGLSH